MKFVVKREELEQAIANCIREAAEFTRMGGETQLYGVHDGLRIYDFSTANFAGHNSWNVGEHIVRLYTKEWFDPIGHWDEREELKNELQGDSELSAEYDAVLTAAEVDGIDKYDFYIFEKCLPERAREMKEEWSKIALDQDIPELTSHAIERLEECDELEILD